MKNLIKLELKKSILSRYFLLALGILTLLAILSGLYMIDSWGTYNPEVVEKYYIVDGKYITNPDLPLFSFYNAWVGGEDLSLARVLFFSLLSICSVLPYGWSFYMERKLGYIRNIVCRVKKEYYFIAKSFAVFLSGAFTVFVPLVVNSFLVSAFIPLCTPFAGYTFYNHVFFGNMWVDLHFTEPVLYMTLYIMLDTLYGGIFSLLAFAVSFYVKNIILVIFLPTLSMLCFKYIEVAIYNYFSGLNPWEYIPTQFLHSRAQSQVMAIVVVSVTVALLIGSLLTIYLRGFHDEIY